jgi:hypothetical protein
MQDAQVWCAASVLRAHPMGLCCVSLAVLWYARHGQSLPEVRRERPWYAGGVGPTFTAMLGKLRLAIWGNRIFEGMGEEKLEPPSLEKLLHCLAAVR